MYKRLFLVASLSLMLAACGGGGSSSDTGGTDTGGTDTGGTDTGGTDTGGTDTGGTDTGGTDTGGTDTGGTDTGGTDPSPTGSYVCSATVASDEAFDDVFVTENTPDRNWGGAATDVYNEITLLVRDFTVDEIAGEFNAARALDPTINEKLKMPSQDTWDNMSASEKALYLVNSERCARGILPLEGIAPAIEDSASLYSQVLSDERVLSHDFGDGPLARIVAAGAVTGDGGNADFTSKSESLAMNQVNSNSPDYLVQHEVEAKVVYDWIYDDIDDQGDGYGHRRHVLLNSYEDNSGDSGSEGLFGMATDAINFDQTSEGTVFKFTESWTVMHSFDPNASYNMASVIAAPSLMGPESQSDCLSGAYTESLDSDGNNTSTCE